jgi:hypothetical protein
MIPRDNRPAANKWVVSGVAAAIAVVIFLLAGGGSRAQLRSQCVERSGALAASFRTLQDDLKKLTQPLTAHDARALADEIGALAEHIKPPTDDGDTLHFSALVADLENLARHLRESTSTTDSAYGSAERVTQDVGAIGEHLDEVAERCR